MKSEAGAQITYYSKGLVFHMLRKTLRKKMSPQPSNSKRLGREARLADAEPAPG